MTFTSWTIIHKATHTPGEMTWDVPDLYMLRKASTLPRVDVSQTTPGSWSLLSTEKAMNGLVLLTQLISVRLVISE